MNQETHFLSYGNPEQRGPGPEFHGQSFESNPLAEAWDSSKLWRPAREVCAWQWRGPHLLPPEFFMTPERSEGDSKWREFKVEGIQAPLFGDSGPNENS